MFGPVLPVGPSKVVEYRRRLVLRQRAVVHRVPRFRRERVAVRVPRGFAAYPVVVIEQVPTSPFGGAGLHSHGAVLSLRENVFRGRVLPGSLFDFRQYYYVRAGLFRYVVQFVYGHVRGTASDVYHYLIVYPDPVELYVCLRDRDIPNVRATFLPVPFSLFLSDPESSGKLEGGRYPRLLGLVPTVQQCLDTFHAGVLADPTHPFVIVRADDLVIVAFLILVVVACVDVVKSVGVAVVHYLETVG